MSLISFCSHVPPLKCYSHWASPAALPFHIGVDEALGRHGCNHGDMANLLLLRSTAVRGGGEPRQRQRPQSFPRLTTKRNCDPRQRTDPPSERIVLSQGTPKIEFLDVLDLSASTPWRQASSS